MLFGKDPRLPDPLEGRPHGPAHLKCPLYQKPMIEVCRSCGWWEGKEVNVGTALEPQVALQYRCDMGWAAQAGESISKRIDALHTAVNSERNETSKLKKSMVALAGAHLAQMGVALPVRVKTTMLEHQDEVERARAEEAPE
jgi:hypothetical protein